MTLSWWPRHGSWDTVVSVILHSNAQRAIDSTNGSWNHQQLIFGNGFLKCRYKLRPASSNNEESTPQFTLVTQLDYLVIRFFVFSSSFFIESHTDGFDVGNHERSHQTRCSGVCRGALVWCLLHPLLCDSGHPFVRLLVPNISNVTEQHVYLAVPLCSHQFCDVIDDFYDEVWLWVWDICFDGLSCRQGVGENYEIFDVVSDPRVLDCSLDCDQFCSEDRFVVQQTEFVSDLQLVQNIPRSYTILVIESICENRHFDTLVFFRKYL